MPSPMNYDNTLCPYCEFGMLHARRATYIRLINGTLLQVPRTPAWQCDTCRELFFDPTHIQMLNVLAGEAGPPPNRHRPDAESASAPRTGSNKPHPRPK